jgi:hypothetical protein
MGSVFHTSFHPAGIEKAERPIGSDALQVCAERDTVAQAGTSDEKKG